MAHLTAKPRAEFVRSMFARIARYYDRANHWMTFGQDAKWRREVLDLAGLPSGGRLLDVGTGTGDLALGAIQRDKSCFAVGVDFTLEMMQQGSRRHLGERVGWLDADALCLPFAAKSFDAVVSGYLMRNVIDIKWGLAEQYRVLKGGGRMVCLDTTPPLDDAWHLPSRIYIRHIIPIVGKLLARDADAYVYLAESTERFVNAEELADRMLKAGFKDVQFHRFLGGTMAIHWGIK
ncbi:MAG: hypothetical protein A2136_04320 [Chloroflexi bacterium RBG_16_54_11]|nr:MAG: hypothetical protein A2136_04320 [Chloroflexi bacterium RBG_16_54_11]